MTADLSPPKLFISYSWSTVEHEQWVLDLATELRESGVDVILDKWDLKEGHDSVAFMEKMVTDPDISKVAVISDKTYAEKADGRAGGVGTETQIISREVYENQAQEKFVAVLPTKDENGKAYLPTYYKGRIYIDLSEPEKYAENFEKLIRWIYNKPLLSKPEIGNRPAFLNETGQISLGTTASLKRCLDALKTNKANATGSIDEYFSIFTDSLEKFRIAKQEDVELDDSIIESIEKFLPHRNELIQLLTTIAQYQPTKEIAYKTHRFIEKLIPYTERPENSTQWQNWDFDNFKFIVHEIFLYTIAIFIKHEQFEFVNELLKTPYYFAENSNRGQSAAIDFSKLRGHMGSLEHRNKRLSLRRLSLRADILKDRAKTSGIEFKSLMQADFILYLRAILESNRWWPETLIYSTHSYGPFEIFARSTSTTYFHRAKVALGLEKKEDLTNLLHAFNQNKHQLPTWEYESINPTILIGIDDLCTRP